MNKFESAVERAKLLLFTLSVMSVMGLFSSCAYETKCPTYTHVNRKTSYGEKAQSHYAKKHKKITYLLF